MRNIDNNSWKSDNFRKSNKDKKQRTDTITKAKKIISTNIQEAIENTNFMIISLLGATIIILSI